MQANTKAMTDLSTSHLSQISKTNIYSVYMQANAKVMADVSASHFLQIAQYIIYSICRQMQR